MPRDSRSKTIQSLQSTNFDVVIVGGGITGAWIAYQCSAAGYSTALIDRGDFASETSAASSKLLHGGIRYLQQLQFHKVRESSMERAEYLYAAPHIASAVPFIVPTFSDLKRSKLVLHCGLLAYSTLGMGQQSILKQSDVSIPNRKSLSVEQLNSICDLRHLEHSGGIHFPEFHMYDTERTVWQIIDSAQRHGAVICNYVKANGLIRKPEKDKYTRVSGLRCVETVPDQKHGTTEEFDVKARMVINAAGPWVDRLNSELSAASDKPSNKDKSAINGYALGAHLITKQLISDHAIAITTEHQSDAAIDRGGRHIFVIPWRGKSLIGTSYFETKNPDEAKAIEERDIHQLLEAVQLAFPNESLSEKDIVSAYSGLYPLRVNKIKGSQYQGSGEYLLIDHEKSDDHLGMVTSLGAKYTTARVLAEKTFRLIAGKLSGDNDKSTHRSETAVSQKSCRRLKLSTSDYESISKLKTELMQSYPGDFSEKQIDHFIACYGSDAKRFLSFTKDQVTELRQVIMSDQPDIYAQALWAIREESAITLQDVLLRRTSLGFLGIGDTQVTEVADLMAHELNWDSQYKQQQLNEFSSRSDAIQATIRSYFNS